MKKFIFSYVVNIFLILIFIILLWIIFSPNLRSKIFSFSSGILNNYYSIAIDNNLRSKNNIESAIKKLEQQIKITDFLTSKEKNSFLDNIYYNAEKIEKFIIKDKDYLKFTNIIENLIKKDPDIYKAIIWQAKLLDLKDSDSEKIINNFDKAISLSSSDPTTYRYVLDYLKKKNLDLFDKYCLAYQNSLQGGSSMQNNKSSFFRGNSLSNFILSLDLNKIDQEFYVLNGMKINENSNYSFVLKEPKREIDNMNFILNYFPGTRIYINSIELVNENNEILKPPLEEMYISSNNTFVDFNKEKLSLIITEREDQIIKIRFNKVFKNISQIQLNLNFNKLNLTNYKNC